jgi:antitoxin MazE
MLLVELRQRSQITIPAEIVKRLNLHEGDQFEVIEKDGGIFLCPVVV